MAPTEEPPSGLGDNTRAEMDAGKANLRNTASAMTPNMRQDGTLSNSAANANRKSNPEGNFLAHGDDSRLRWDAANPGPGSAAG